ncbi:MAG: Rrf2 family transcriptional regulator [Bacteroidota bacterium]
MKLSKKSEYACLAMIDLTEHYDAECVKIFDISVRKSIPKKFLEQILIVLKNAGYVKSKKGADGGYKLNKDPREIMLAEVIRLMDGALAPVESASTYFYVTTPSEQHKKLMVVFKDIRDYIAKKLESTSFYDITR